MQTKEGYTYNDHLVITDLGKFEGEPRYVPHFWEVFLDGFVDTDDGQYLRFRVTDEDKIQFPELSTHHWVTLLETDQGFVVVV